MLPFNPVRHGHEEFPDPDPDSMSDHDRILEAMRHLDSRLDTLDAAVRRVQIASYIAAGLIAGLALKACT